ncbi:Protein AHNAK2, partial [Ophiophagus hannah]
MPKLEASLPEAKLHVEKPEVKGGDITISAPEIKFPTGSASLELEAPAVDVEAPTGKVETDVTLPKGKVEVSEGAAAIKLPEAEGSIDGGGLKLHKPKFKMPRMGFSKPDIKVPKIDVDVSMPKLEASLPKAELCPAKPELKRDKPLGDIDISVPKIVTPSGQGSLEVISPCTKIEPPSSMAVQVPDIQLGSEDSKFKMPKVGISGPKGKGFSEGEVTIPSMEGDLPKTGLKMEITLPSSELEADITLPEVNREAPILDVEVEEKGKTKTPQVKLPSVKPPKLTAPEVGISLPKVEGDVFLPKPKAELPDSEAASKVAEAEGSREKGRMKIHMPKFKMPSMGFSKSDIKGPKIDSDASMPDVHTSLPKVELSTTKPQVKTDEFEGDIRRAAPEVKIPWVPVTVELQAPDVEVQASSGKIPDIAIGLSKDVDVPQLKTTADIIDIAMEAPTLEMESDVLDEKKDVLEQKIKMPQIIRADVKTAAVGIPSVDISVTQSEVSTQDLHGAAKEPEAKGQITKRGNLDGEEKGHFKMPKFKLPSLSWSPKKEMTAESEELGGKTQPLQVKSDEEIAEEIQTEESQSWFKMPKFKIPSFGRTSKTKKSDAEIEDITGEAHVTELQAEVKSPEVVTISRELDSEKSTSEQKAMLPQKDVRVQKEQQSTTDQLMDEGSFLQSSEKIGRKPSDLEPKTYADIVKEGAEGQSSQTEFIGTIPKMDIERNIPKTEMTIQQPQVIPGIMAVAEIPPTEITMGKKIDASITDPEPLQSLDRQAEKMGTEKKSPKKDSQGKESIFKMPTFSVPLFGWSTTKSDAIVPGIESDLEEPAVTLSKVKVDVSITDEDFEIIDFPVEGFEKDLPKEGEVKAEEKEKTSKTKASKFKIPKFANLRSKSQGGEMQIDSPKVQTEVSLVRPEGETSGIQIQDKKPGDAEESFQMPKFKMLKFTHRISEGEKLTSEETMDIKETADGDISQLQFKTMFPEEKGDDIQKSKVRITTLSEPAIQRPQVGSKFQSTDSSFVDTTMCVHKQVPKEFSAEFLKEKMDTMDNNVQKSIAKITTLKEPDIQRAPLEIKLQPDDPFSSSAPVQVKGSVTESKEIKMESKSSFGCGDVAEIQGSFSTQIVKESEIPPSEVKTAAFGFSLLKVKIQESHVSLDVPVKLSSTKCMGEIFEDKDHQLSGPGEAAQKAGLSEVKPSDITYEYIEGTSSAATLTTLKSFTVDIQSSGEFAESHSEPIEISKSAIETAGETAFTSSTDEVTDEKDSKRSGRFKLWFPSIGFSPTTDDTTSESKPEAQQKVQPDDSSKLDNETAKETEKAGWFRFPKLGFSSPTKKSKEVGKEKETDSKEGEESPTDKNETFFDAQETLALKEKEENETSGDIPSEPIVSSSARTELILLEKGKAEPKHTPEDPSK